MRRAECDSLHVIVVGYERTTNEANLRIPYAQVMLQSPGHIYDHQTAEAVISLGSQQRKATARAVQCRTAVIHNDSSLYKRYALLKVLA